MGVEGYSSSHLQHPGVLQAIGLLEFKMVNGPGFVTEEAEVLKRFFPGALLEDGSPLCVQLVKVVSFQLGEFKFGVAGNSDGRIALVNDAPAVNLVECWENEKMGEGRLC
jgi:hypothetical protein